MMKKDALKFAALLLVALGSAPAYSAYWQWSKTAATNATADPSINWSEGMSPSSVNDSARAMMARAAEERDDVSGLLATGGSSTAYTVATNQGLNTPTPTDGQLIAVTVSATNGIAPTLAADGGTAFPIQSSAGVAVAAGTLVSGSPYTLKFSAANSSWLLRNFYGAPLTVPLGAVMSFTGDTPPNSNFILPYGQAISRTTYAAYFAMVGTRFGVGDGTTTFNVPDLRDRTIYGSASMGGGAPPGRISAIYFGSSSAIIGNVGGLDHTTLLQANLPNVNFANSGITVADGRAFQTAEAVPHAGSVLALPGSGGVLAASIAKVAIEVSNGGSLSVSAQGSAASGGSGTAAATISPGMILNYILRVQ